MNISYSIHSRRRLGCALLPLLVGCACASGASEAERHPDVSSSTHVMGDTAASNGTTNATNASQEFRTTGGSGDVATSGENTAGTSDTPSSETDANRSTAPNLSEGTSTGATSANETTSPDASTPSTSDAVDTSIPEDVVTRANSTFAFEHYPIETDADGVWNGPTMPGNTTVTTTFDTVVLENGVVKVTLLPSYGGRILSLFHKPSNREFLYQNPVGTPYLMQEDIFYYNYLVIMGGIFPSFPEPEHGKYWDQPYDFEVVNENDAAITVRMSRVDDRSPTTGVPTQYDVGRTDVRVELEVTLRAGSAAVELNTRLINTRAEAVPKFEYWTITTLAPGSPPGETAIPLNTRILAKMDQVHLYESSWSWFGDAEQRIDGEVFQWNNLASFENWVDQGTAFANPAYETNWSGLMNADNQMSIVCATDPTKVLGLKLWTFGAQSLDVDLNDSTQWLRPTIEMWHGVTPEFWERGTLAPNEVREWKDYYFPTFGLTDITAANAIGALQLTSSKGETETTLSVAASLTVTNRVHALVRVGDQVVHEQELEVSLNDATRWSVKVPNATAPTGAVFEVELLQGDVSRLVASEVLP